MKTYSKYIKEPRQQKQQTTTNNINIESSMTSQQRFNSITESVMANIAHNKIQSLKGCQIHPKISKKCRKCQEIQTHINFINLKHDDPLNLLDTFPQFIKLNTNNVKAHFNQKLQKNIEDDVSYKTKIRPLRTVKQLTSFLTADQISISAYIIGSSDTTTIFMAIFYRLAQLRPTHQQLVIMLRSNNVNIRCLALLYTRVFIDATDVYGCLAPSFKETKILFAQMTIGEYAIRLLDQEQLNHWGFRLPRLPVRIQREIERRVTLFQEKSYQRQLLRQRSRSREPIRGNLIYENRQQIDGGQQSSHSNDSYDQPPIKQQQIKAQCQKVCSLKQRIATIEQKNAAQRTRRELLQKYKKENVLKLSSDEEGYEENDEVEKMEIG